MKKKKNLIVSFIVIICLIAVGSASVLGANAYVKMIGGKRIISPEKATELTDVDCIIILGCGVDANGNPSWMLEDRLKKGIELYKKGAAHKILMSGDHGRKFYDEVNTMKQFAMDTGVPSSDIFMDHAGFSTYESMYRAKEIFEAESVIIVTQEYHLYRAVYIAEKLGLKAYGVSATERVYGGETYFEQREILARCKDFLITILKPKPTYLGEVIPVSGDGNITND
ncbi:MAG: SanA protein [Ruminococcaceae bacterium]|nr:SanA protein [Oscillospiraceae bacterium]